MDVIEFQREQKIHKWDIRPPASYIRDITDANIISTQWWKLVGPICLVVFSASII